MIRLFGDISLYFALFFALIQSTLPLIGYFKQNKYLLATARPSAYGQACCLLAAYILLTVAFGTNDFSIAYVAANSHPSLPIMYRLTAVWGAHEGSMLLWVLILNAWTIAFTFCKQYPQSLAIAVFGIISFCFLCFLILTSSPFLPALTEMPAQDLNPLLQDPGFVIHPPMLYIGYVGFVAAFALTQAALIRGQLDAAWANITRHFAIAAWIFLTFGITLGSWWAYRVLGWGGFWFWDPVENASLLPWLAGTALIHVLILVEKRGIAKAWAALLAIISFALSLLGTFLVRSGVLVSAHTFANDPARGVFLLLLLAIVLTTALGIYVYRLPELAGNTGTKFSLFSRETSLLINSALLFIAMTTILLGTLYPLILDALKLGSISVGAPYFNLVMLPLVFITMVLMGFGAMSRWQGQPLKPLLKQAGIYLLISFITALLLLWSYTKTIDITALLSITLSFWIILSIINVLRITPGMAFAHAGFAILVIGIMLSSVLSKEQEVRVKPGDVTNIGPYQFLFVEDKGVSGANFRGIQATFDVMKGERHVTNLYPEKRIYTVRDMIMTKVDIHPGIFRDLYIALGEPLDKNYWSVRIYYKPFMRFIWLGGLIMMIGGFLTLSNRKLRNQHGEA